MDFSNCSPFCFPANSYYKEKQVVVAVHSRDGVRGGNVLVTTRSVKSSRQLQQKLTALREAVTMGRKRRLQASLHTHTTAAPSNTPSMAKTKQHRQEVYIINHCSIITGFFFTPVGAYTDHHPGLFTI